MTYTFPDKHDEKCYLVINDSGDGGVSIHGWNDNTDSFTSVDLSAEAAATVADVLREIAADAKAIADDTANMSERDRIMQTLASGEWQFTQEEMDLMDLKPGDYLGGLTVGQPVPPESRLT